MKRSALLVVVSIVLAAPLSRGREPAPASDHASIVKDFETRVAQYMGLRTKEAGSPPSPTDSTTKLAESQEQMADSVRAARSSAHQGDIFTPEIAQYFRHLIAATFSAPQGRRIRESLRHAEPLSGISLKVNDKYPEGAPLQSTPPSLLLNLPKLPKELEYRIVGSTLVLHDTGPNLIVDFIPNAVPQS